MNINKNKYIFSFVIFFFIISRLVAFSQITSPGIPSDKDTSIIFSPSIDLYQNISFENEKTNYVGINIDFSDHGLGLGASYQYSLSRAFSINAQLLISGAHNSDEFEIWDYNYMDYRVPNKINRIYFAPLMLGIKYRLFSSTLTNKLRPFIEAGSGISWILATPYDIEFFKAFSKAKNYFKPVGYGGVGVDIMSGSTFITFGMKYLYIPFGGDGLASVRNKPITNFGGIFLELTAKMPL